MSSKKRRRLKKPVLYLLILLLIVFLYLFFFNKPKQEEKIVYPEETATANIATPTPTIETTPTPTPTYNPEEDERFFDLDSYLVVANKKHALPIDYVPSDLTTPNVEMRYNTWQLREKASLALEEMFNAAESEGIHLICGSGYRSADFQKILYDSYVEKYGQDGADTISSRPGYSDHQTGLATDICATDQTTDLSEIFEDTEEGKWLKDNAHKYGFIMRYPKGKAEITGYAYEPWHFRYIGEEEATAIYEKGEFYSFEEFYGISGGDYDN